MISSRRPRSAGSPSNCFHAADANYFLIDPAMGKKMPPEEDPKRADYKTKADVVAFVKKSFADGADAIQAKGDKGMSDLLVDPFAHQEMRFSTWRTASSSTRANTTANSSSTTASPASSHRNHAPKNKTLVGGKNRRQEKSCHPEAASFAGRRACPELVEGT